MFDVRQMLLSTFADRTAELAFQYQRLRSISAEEREIAVGQANDELKRIKKDIGSHKTTAAITALIKYQYATRFAFAVHYVDEHGNEDNESKIRFLRKFQDADSEHLSSSGAISSFRYDTPSENVFVQLIYQALIRKDFYSQVNTVCDDLYGVSLPSDTAQEFQEWLNYSGLQEESWAWQYKNNIEKWSSRWIRPKKKIERAMKSWDAQKAGTDGCISYVRSHFGEITKSVEWLSGLKMAELNLTISVSNLNTVHAAVKDGTKLKHLLLEEGIESAELFQKITKGL